MFDANSTPPTATRIAPGYEPLRASAGLGRNGMIPLGEMLDAIWVKRRQASAV
jgi:hypothetical protein